MLKAGPKRAQSESSQIRDGSKNQRLDHPVSGHTDDETSDEEKGQAKASSDNDDTSNSSEDGSGTRHKIRYQRISKLSTSNSLT